MLPDPTHPHWIPGSGRKPADIAFVGEAPSYDELESGLPFTGPSGKILWQMAGRHAGLLRSQIYTTNWHKLPLTKELKKELEKDPEQVEEWTRYLEDELYEVRPSLIVALGSHATRALLPREVDLFWANGIPFADDDRVVIPVVHPAAALHEPDMLARTVQGLQGVRAFLDGKVAPRAGFTPIDMQVLQYQIRPGAEVGIDTEGPPDDPICATVSFDGHEVLYVDAADPTQTVFLRKLLEETRPVIYLHNSLWDAGVLRTMGIEVWDYEVRDTMVAAYNLQDIPRDLKNLARRELNVEMTEFEKVVAPYYEQADGAWRLKLGERIMRDLQYVEQRTPKGKVRMSKGQPVTKIEGPEPQLAIQTRLARGFQLKPFDVHWAEREIGARPNPMDLRLVPPEIAQAYASKDAAVTRRLGPVLWERTEREGLAEARELDMAVQPMVEDFQQAGMHIDVLRYGDIMGEISQRKEVVRGLVQEVTAGAIDNPGSGDQVAEFCRQTWIKEGKLGLTKMTRGKTRETVDDNVLSVLREEHPVIPLILEYRELDKYDGTYLMPLGELIKQLKPGDFRIMPRLRTTRVVSGRLSATAPNVLAWPARTELGLRLRSIFTAPPGMVLASWDLSQIELRLAAAFSRDPVMTEAFVSGRDLHANLASKLFGASYEDCLEGPGKLKYRTPAKNIHYGLLYGMEALRLWEELTGLGITAYSRDDCARLLKETWQLYKVCGAWLDSSSMESRRTGMVRDFIGRRRFLPATQLSWEGEWKIRSLIREAERQGGNFKIQGAAAEILKRTMVTVWNEVYPAVRKLRLHFRLWLQVHDELMGELDKSAWEVVNSLMVKAMVQDGFLTAPIPIETTGVTGSDWGELKG